MKKFLVTLGIATCVFGLTACGSSDPDRVEGDPVSQDAEKVLIGYGEQEASQIEQVAASGQSALVADDEVYGPALDSYENALKDLGTVQGFLADDEYAVQTDKDEYTVNIGLDGSDHDADMQIVYSVNDSNQIKATAITTNVRYSFGELMEQAALNTVLGMGTTFVVLIILALLISLFRFIPKIQAAFSRKKEAPAPEPAAEPAVEETAAEEPEEELTDDGELVAVIAAAVAASEGHATTDGFVVRSIRKSRKRI